MRDDGSGCIISPDIVGQIIPDEYLVRPETLQTSPIKMTGNRFLHVLASLVVVAFLLIYYGRYIELSGDFVMHFMLVDELMKHGMRRPDVHDIGMMNIYPDGAHWMAAVLGWIGGSGLVAIVLITVASVFVCYLLLIELVGKDSPVRVALATLAFMLLAGTHSLIGWEVNVNYFYPQLVDNIALLGTLLLLVRVHGEWKQAGMAFAIGALAMFIHPLVALQILACGLVFLAWHGITVGHAFRRIPLQITAATVALLVGSLAILKFHPAFQAMRQAAENDGYLVFSYSNVLLVALMCAFIGIVSLYRPAHRQDTVIACACIATASLALMQYAALRYGHIGSNYAVKKHMFVVVTLAAISAIRLISRWRGIGWNMGWIFAPVLAGLASIHILEPFNTPVAPVLRAISYANYVAQFDLAGFRPGNTVSDDRTQSPMINFMISTTAFQQPFGVKQTTWIYGADPTIGATYAMVRRTPEVDATCHNRYAEVSDYVMVDPSCLRR
jgi:hypothetical protein